MTHPQFRKFCVDCWKTITSLPRAEVTAHLYSACESSVQNSIINAIPTFLTLDESSALTQLEKIVTRQLNPLVHRMQFSNLLQGDTESIKEFVVRLRSAAVECEYTCPDCSSDLSPIYPCSSKQFTANQYPSQGWPTDHLRRHYTPCRGF